MTWCHLLCFGSLCLAGCGTHDGTAPDVHSPASRQAPGPGLDLVDQLVRPYYPAARGEWLALFQSGHFPVNLARRNAAVADLARELATLPAPPKVLIIEHLGGGHVGTYERVVVFHAASPPDPLPAALTRLRATPVAAGEWQAIERPASLLLMAGGVNFGMGRMYDAEDATVITLYDGHAWRTDTWFLALDGPLLGPVASEDDGPHILPFQQLLTALNAAVAPRSFCRGRFTPVPNP